MSDRLVSQPSIEDCGISYHLRERVFLCRMDVLFCKVMVRARLFLGDKFAASQLASNFQSPVSSGVEDNIPLNKTAMGNGGSKAEQHVFNAYANFIPNH